MSNNNSCQKLAKSKIFFHGKYYSNDPKLAAFDGRWVQAEAHVLVESKHSQHHILVGPRLISTFRSSGFDVATAVCFWTRSSSFCNFKYEQAERNLDKTIWAFQQVWHNGSFSLLSLFCLLVQHDWPPCWNCFESISFSLNCSWLLCSLHAEIPHTKALDSAMIWQTLLIFAGALDTLCQWRNSIFANTYSICSIYHL